MVAPNFVNAFYGNATTSVSVNVTASGIVANDLLFCTATNSVTNTGFTLAGWTALNESPTLQATLLYKFADATDVANQASPGFTFTCNASGSPSATLEVWRAVDQVTPFAAGPAITRFASSTSWAAPSLTAANAGKLISTAVIAGGVTHVLTKPGSMTQNYQTNTTRSRAGAEESVASGATGTRTWTVATATVGHVAAAVLNPSGSTGTGTITLSGSATHSSTATGGLSLSGSAAAATTDTATGSLTLGATANAQAPTTATGSLSLSATATSTADGTATGTVTLSGSGTGSVASSGTGNLTLTGTANAATTAAGAAELTLSGTAAGTGPATASGQLNLAGTATSRAAVGGQGDLVLIGTAFTAALVSALGTIELAGTADAHAHTPAEPAPPERTFVVAGETRLLVVTRPFLFFVGAESRVLTVAAESRTLTVPTEARTLEVHP